MTLTSVVLFFLLLADVSLFLMSPSPSSSSPPPPCAGCHLGMCVCVCECIVPTSYVDPNDATRDGALACEDVCFSVSIMGLAGVRVVVVVASVIVE